MTAFVQRINPYSPPSKNPNMTQVSEAHRLLEQMYDALDRPTLDRHLLRKITDEISTQTMVCGTVEVRQDFVRPEFNRLYLEPRERLFLGILEKNFARAVSTQSLKGALQHASSKEFEGSSLAKLAQVYVCRLRKKLRGTGFGIRTEWAYGYTLDIEENAPFVGQVQARIYPRGRERPVWRGHVVSAGAQRLAQCLERNNKSMTREQIIADAPFTSLSYMKTSRSELNRIAKSTGYCVAAKHRGVGAGSRSEYWLERV